MMLTKQHWISFENSISMFSVAPNCAIIPFILLISIYSPFVGPLLFFRFTNLIHSRWDSLDRGSARRKAATYIKGNTITEWTHTNIYASSVIRIHDLVVGTGDDSSCLRPRGHCDRPIHTHEIQIFLWRFFPKHLYVSKRPGSE
jgi:hypothetical protein